MSAIVKIEERYGLTLPADYLSLLKEDHLSWHGPNASPNFLFLTDLEWLSIDEIACYEFLDQIPGLVPFAITARRDEWAWRVDWALHGVVPVVHCGNVDSAYGYAPSFAGFLYRVLLEEFSGTWLPQDFGADGTVDQFHRYVDWVSPLLPVFWVGTLRKVLASHPKLLCFSDGSQGLFSREEADTIIARDLQFAHLDEEFSHYIDKHQS
jgi:hypothetical protein